MFGAEIQNLIALAAVTLAVGYLARAAYRVIARPKGPGCGACGSCPATKADGETAPPGLVSLETLRESAATQRNGG